MYELTVKHCVTAFWKVQYKQRLLFAEVLCHCKSKCQIATAGIGQKSPPTPNPTMKSYLFSTYGTLLLDYSSHDFLIVSWREAAHFSMKNDSSWPE